MSEPKTFKKAIEDLLALSPTERKAKQPADGFEELANAMIEKAISDADSPMMKYLADLASKGVEESPTGAKSTKSKLDMLAGIAEEGIDE